MRGKPVVAVLIPQPIRVQVLSEETEHYLASFAEVVSPVELRPERWNLERLLTGVDACLTGWDTPSLPNELLVTLPTLRLVAHTGGSIRNLVPVLAIDRGLKVSHASAYIAEAVAEMVLLQALLHLRRLHLMDQEMRQGVNWADVFDRNLGRLLGARTVGVIGASHVGRAVIRLLKAFGCRVRVYDPLLGRDAASRLQVESVTLAELLRSCDVISLHAPVLPETRGMLGADELKLIRDGTLIINTARAALVDGDALVRHLQSGRLVAALDVFDTEPLPNESELRRLPNVILSPHAAGHTIETQFRQGAAMVAELDRFFRDEPLKFEIDPNTLSVIA